MHVIVIFICDGKFSFHCMVCCRLTVSSTVKWKYSVCETCSSVFLRALTGTLPSHAVKWDGLLQPLNKFVVFLYHCLAAWHVSLMRNYHPTVAASIAEFDYFSSDFVKKVLPCREYSNFPKDKLWFRSINITC